MAAELNPDEINALMDAIQDGRTGKASAEGEGEPRESVVPYDLTSRDRIIRGQMPTLDAINEQVASIFGSGLSGRIRQSLRVSSSPSSLVRFGDFASVLAPPATVCVLTLGKTYGLCLAVLEPGVADSLLAAAMGDRKAQATPDAPARRDLTSVERFVLKRLLSILTEAMRQAWTSVMPIEPEVLRFETDPRMATIAPPQEAAIVCTFEFAEGITGRIQLAVPFTAVESEKKALAAPPKVNTGVDQRFAASLAEELAQVRVELRAILGRSQSSFAHVLELAVGDVITLDTDERSALEVLVEGRSKLMGTPGVSGSNLSIVVDEPVRGPMAPAPDSKKTTRPLQFSVA